MACLRFSSFFEKPKDSLVSLLRKVRIVRFCRSTCDHQVAFRLFPDGHNHNGHMLTGSGQRSQKPSLPIGTVHTQMLKTQIQLVKLNVQAGA
jgi:hypothetical protein